MTTIADVTVLKDLGPVLRVTADGLDGVCIVPKNVIGSESPVREGEGNEGPGDLVVSDKWAQRRGFGS